MTKRGDEGYIFLIDRRTANEREGIASASPRKSPRVASVSSETTPEQWIYHVRFVLHGQEFSSHSSNSSAINPWYVPRAIAVWYSQTGGMSFQVSASRGLQ